MSPIEIFRIYNLFIFVFSSSPFRKKDTVINQSKERDRKNIERYAENFTKDSERLVDSLVSAPLNTGEIFLAATAAGELGYVSAVFFIDSIAIEEGSHEVVPDTSVSIDWAAFSDIDTSGSLAKTQTMNRAKRRMLSKSMMSIRGIIKWIRNNNSRVSYLKKKYK